MPVSRLIMFDTGRKRLSRMGRLGRAAWRNARVILREFRWPISVFLVAVLGGGWLYGELLVQAGYERLPFIDMPYSMLSLMIFQPPLDLPSEPQLVVFWYAMPVIFGYVAARGILDFVRLFYNPDEGRSSWEEAVASTYSGHVIVLGVGHLGTRVVRAVVGMGFEVVAIDRSAEIDKREILDRLNVPLVVADGRLASTLETAGIRKARALIVCTSNDHMNLEVTMRARDLNPTIRIVVRMWEDQFASQIQHFMNVEAVLSATDLAAPSFAAAALGIEISQTFVVDGVEYSMIELQVGDGSFLDGHTVQDIQANEGIDIVLHGRAGQVRVHPAHEVLIAAGDTLVLFAQHNKIMDVVGRNQGRRVITSKG